jgi:hypothetical protein
MLPTFQYFGSGDSKDLDMIFFMDKMPPTIAEAAAKCAALSELHQTSFPTSKIINCNLAIVQNGILIDSFKGNLDELNNSLLLTYDLHVQAHPNHITKQFVRDVDLKFLRASRSILSHLTKTQHRIIVKNALKGDIHLKYNVLQKIDLNDLDWSNAKLDIVEIKKALAFQIGQTLALWNGQEIYTKKEIGLAFPSLKPYLDRQPKTDFKDLQNALILFGDALKTKMIHIKSGYEYKFNPFKNL